VPYGKVLSAATVCYAALGAVLAVLPARIDELHAGPLMLGLAVGAPALTGVLARPLGGRLADRHGPARMLRLGALAMAVAGTLALVPGGIAPLIVSRLAVGAAEGVMMSATVLWLLRLAGPSRRGRALGHIGLANYAGLASGALVASLLGGGHAAVTVLAVAAALPLAGAAIGVLVRGRHGARVETATTSADTRQLLARTARPGVGLLLVNVGYAAVLAFGARAVAHHGLVGAQLVVPVYAVTIIAVRTVGGFIPDRYGGRRTLIVAASAEAVGLVALALAWTSPLALAAVAVLAVGQALAVPALGMLALAPVPAERHGEASGLFFAWFDAGVGLGGPAVGALAATAGAAGALIGAGAAVALTAPIVLAAR
jgi:MFS family permease